MDDGPSKAPHGGSRYGVVRIRHAIIGATSIRAAAHGRDRNCILYAPKFLHFERSSPREKFRKFFANNDGRLAGSLAPGRAGRGVRGVRGLRRDSGAPADKSS